MKSKTIIPENPVEPEGRVVERPDGFHWLSEDGRREGGPFPSFVEALEDMHHNRSEDDQAAVSFQEAEADSGLDWVDEETGELTEDASFHIAD